jgi:hypothetical protein
MLCVELHGTLDTQNRTQESQVVTFRCVCLGDLPSAGVCSELCCVGSGCRCRCDESPGPNLDQTDEDGIGTGRNDIEREGEPYGY